MSVREDIWQLEEKIIFRTGGNKNTRYKYYFDVEKCKICPFKRVAIMTVPKANRTLSRLNQMNT